MADNNGIATIKWGIGLIIVPAIFILVGNVVANDQKNTVEHKEIRADISNFRVEQMRQGTILERIDNKL